MPDREWEKDHLGQTGWQSYMWVHRQDMTMWEEDPAGTTIGG